MALPYDPRDWRIGLGDGVRGLRVAASPRLGYVHDLHPEIAAEAEAFTAGDVIGAQMVRARMGAAMQALHTRHDVLLTPTLPIAAFAAGQEVPDPARQQRWTEWSPYCYAFNMTMQPAISIPCGLTEAGLPIGSQIIGPAHDDAIMLRAARASEAARPFARIGAPS